MKVYTMELHPFSHTLQVVVGSLPEAYGQRERHTTIKQITKKLGQHVQLQEIWRLKQGCGQGN